MSLTLKGLRLRALIDTGASRTVLRRAEFMELCDKIGRQPLVKRTSGLQSVTGHELHVWGETEIEEESLGVISVTVVNDLPYPMIVGRDVLCADGAVINYPRGVLTWREQELTLGPASVNPALGHMAAMGRDAEVIRECVESNADVFSAKGQQIGRHPEIAIRIETTGPPLRQRAYRVPFLKREALGQKLDEMLEQGIIEPSSSPWASPVVLVEKKDPSEGPRFCVDYTRLNNVTVKDSYPVPLIREVLDSLQGATVFSTLDLKSGFHQLPLHEDDKAKTAFICFRGLYQFRCLPMGLTNATSVFQRAMEKVLHGLIGVCCMIC